MYALFSVPQSQITDGRFLECYLVSIGQTFIHVHMIMMPTINGGSSHPKRFDFYRWERHKDPSTYHHHKYRCQCPTQYLSALGPPTFPTLQYKAITNRMAGSLFLSFVPYATHTTMSRSVVCKLSKRHPSFMSKISCHSPTGTEERGAVERGERGYDRLFAFTRSESGSMKGRVWKFYLVRSGFLYFSPSGCVSSHFQSRLLRVFSC